MWRGRNACANRRASKADGCAKTSRNRGSGGHCGPGGNRRASRHGCPNRSARARDDRQGRRHPREQERL